MMMHSISLHMESYANVMNVPGAGTYTKRKSSIAELHKFTYDMHYIHMFKQMPIYRLLKELYMYIAVVQ